MGKSIIRFVWCVFWLVWGIASAAAAPLPVSPGRTHENSAVEQCCPTFSWAAVAAADGYELVVFALDDFARLS
ncbi:MAG: hypothetical protein JXR89_12445, partial [Deltaproteobacteria bacterium]|nr:hypothetical protein [Deltaproteobacteria bacterium]